MPFNNMRRKIKQQISNVLEIPNDIMLDLPKIVVVGNVQVLIENHRGIVAYSSEQIRVSVSCGELEIRGQELVLRNILPEEMVIEGKIQAVSYL